MANEKQWQRQEWREVWIAINNTQKEKARENNRQWETARDSKRQRETARNSEKQREIERVLWYVFLWYGLCWKRPVVARFCKGRGAFWKVQPVLCIHKLSEERFATVHHPTKHAVMDGLVGNGQWSRDSAKVASRLDRSNLSYAYINCLKKGLRLLPSSHKVRSDGRHTAERQ